jgi:hypothetical protein
LAAVSLAARIAVSSRSMKISANMAQPPYGRMSTPLAGYGLEVRLESSWRFPGD